MNDVRETLDSLYGSLSLANGIGLDENVARNYRRDVPKLLSAVERVLELHAPFEWDYDHTETRCASCFDVYPCPTVQAIQEALGGVNHD